jgi:hypothetical protein
LKEHHGDFISNYNFVTAMVTTGESSTHLMTYDLYSSLWNETKISQGVFEKVKESITTLSEIFYLYGMDRPMSKPTTKEQSSYRKHIFDSLNLTFIRYLSFLEENGELEWMSLLKYKTLNFYAFYETEGTDLLPVDHRMIDDNPGVIFGGRFLGYQKFLKHKNLVLFSSFILTINMAKMGLPRPTEDMVKAAEYKTANHLCTPPPDALPLEYLDMEDYFGLSSNILNKESMIAQLERTVEEIFQNEVYTEDHHYEPFCPSTSSNYNYTRSKGGAVGAVFDQFIAGDPFYRTDEDLVKVEYRPCLVSEHLSERYGAAAVDEMEADKLELRREKEVNALVYDDRNLRSRWEELFDHIHNKAITEPPIVKPVGLSEALKVRVISKGPPLTYTALKPLQTFMWSVLKRHRVFRLIGEQVLEEHINETIGSVEDDDIILNGDFKASTDNLHSWVSETLANKLVRVLNGNVTSENKGKTITPDHAQMLIRSLTKHLFEMEDKTFKEQKEGQLMGSITSFPFLCLANASMCRWALEISNRTRYRLTNRTINEKSLIAPLLINGDDCTMKGNRLTLRHNWNRITNYGGLTSSVGKTLYSLVHKPITVINSQTFDYDSANRLWKVRRYINLGILMGKPRSGLSAEESVRPYHVLGTMHRELKRSCPVEVFDEVSRRFIYYNKSTLKQYPDIPWTCPEYLGGPGLLPQGDISEKDRRVMSLLILYKDQPNYKIQKCRTPAEWHFHSLVQNKYKSLKAKEVPYSKIRSPSIIGDEFNTLWDNFIEFRSLEDESARLYKLLIVESLFKNDMKDYFKKASKDPNRKAMYRNSQSHRNAYALVQGELGPHNLIVRTTEELLYQKKVVHFPVWGNMNDPRFLSEFGRGESTKDSNPETDHLGHTCENM